jgi:hypothetical protein
LVLANPGEEISLGFVGAPLVFFEGIFAVTPGIFENGVERGSGQIEAADQRNFVIAADGVADAEAADEAKRLSVAFEAVLEAFLVSQAVQFFFGNVAERRVTEVVCQCSGFGDIGIQAERLSFLTLFLDEALGDAASELRDLQRMSEAVVKNVSAIGGDHLGNFGQTRESAGVENTVSINLARGAVVGAFFGVETFSARGQTGQLSKLSQFGEPEVHVIGHHNTLAQDEGKYGSLHGGWSGVGFLTQFGQKVGHRHFGALCKCIQDLLLNGRHVPSNNY